MEKCPAEKQPGKYPEQKDPISLSRRQSLRLFDQRLIKTSTDQALETFKFNRGLVLVLFDH
ncbi:hypothetical protein EK599_12025 [Vibrio sp. T187]|nr:hypothetical protein [Vibrio sp. T187]